MLSGETRLPYWHLCNEIPKNPTDVESDKAKQGVKTTSNNPWPRACVRPHGSLNFHSHSIGTEVPLPHQVGTMWEEACGRVRTVTIKQQWWGALLWMVKEAKWETWIFAPTWQFSAGPSFYYWSRIKTATTMKTENLNNIQRSIILYKNIFIYIIDEYIYSIYKNYIKLLKTERFQAEWKRQSIDRCQDLTNILEFSNMDLKACFIKLLQQTMMDKLETDKKNRKS